MSHLKSNPFEEGERVIAICKVDKYLTVGKKYKIVYTVSKSCYVRADDGIVRSFSHSNFEWWGRWGR